MKKLIAILTCLGVMLFAGMATALTIGFDEFNAETETVALGPDYEGFTWSSFYVISNTYFNNYFNREIEGNIDFPSMNNAVFNDYGVTNISIEAPSGTFDFEGASFIALSRANVVAPSTLTVTAYGINDTLIGSEMINLLLSEFTALSASYQEVVKLEFSWNTVEGQWLMDDFLDSTPNGEPGQPIPEPITLLLLGIGLVGLGLASRK